MISFPGFCFLHLIAQPCQIMSIVSTGTLLLPFYVWAWTAPPAWGVLPSELVYLVHRRHLWRLISGFTREGFCVCCQEGLFLTHFLSPAVLWYHAFLVCFLASMFTLVWHSYWHRQPPKAPLERGCETGGGREDVLP